MPVLALRTNAPEMVLGDLYLSNYTIPHVELYTSASKDILQILETLLEITHVLYMPSSEASHTPKLLWRLSNLAWLQSELCKTVFCSPKVVSRDNILWCLLSSSHGTHSS